MARHKGSLGGLHRTVKETVENVFNELQGNEHLGKKYQLREWAKENPGEFYKLAGKMIPRAIEAKIDGDVALTVVTGVPGKPKPADDFSEFA